LWAAVARHWEEVMTKLLERAFKRASHLPEVEQNALARWLIDELEAERAWDARFAESEDVLESLANEAIELRKKGKAKSLDLSRL